MDIESAIEDRRGADFVCYELMTTDMNEAESFYRAVVGWDA